MAPTTRPSLFRGRFNLLMMAAGLAVIGIVVALIVTSTMRVRWLARVRAVTALEKAREVLPGHIILTGGIPQLQHLDTSGGLFLSQHFERSPRATPATVAAGSPAVLVRPDSQWILEDPAVVRQLSELNRELARFCRAQEENGAKPISELQAKPQPGGFPTR